jgi:hypothetical protein
MDEPDKATILRAVAAACLERDCDFLGVPLAYGATRQK